jgi:hypothetical protein
MKWIDEDGDALSIVSGPPTCLRWTDRDGKTAQACLTEEAVSRLRDSLAARRSSAVDEEGVRLHWGSPDRVSVYMPYDGHDLLSVYLTAEQAQDIARCLEKPPSDLKPRGAKRQWWLFPFDALEEILEAEPVQRVALVASDPRSVAGFSVAQLAILSKSEGSQEAALDLVCQVLEHGAEKYSPDNWRGAGEDLLAFRREYFSAMVRHLSAEQCGEPIDPDSGLPHMAHAICNGLFWTWHEMRHAGRALGSGSFSDV